jgi:hypothetical protein
MLDPVFNSVSTAVVQSQLRTVPPYLAGAIWAVALSYVSFRMKKRAVPVILSGSLMIAGYAIAISTDLHASHARSGTSFFFSLSYSFE